jgi:hypothetical protein
MEHTSRVNRVVVSVGGQCWWSVLVVSGGMMVVVVVVAVVNGGGDGGGGDDWLVWVACVDGDQKCAAGWLR